MNERLDVLMSIIVGWIVIVIVLAISDWFRDSNNHTPKL